MSEKKRPFLIIPNNTYIPVTVLGIIIAFTMWLTRMHQDIVYTKALAEADHEANQQFREQVIERLSAIEQQQKNVSMSKQDTASIAQADQFLTKSK